MNLLKKIFYRPPGAQRVGFSPIRWPWEGHRWRKAEAVLKSMKEKKS